MSVKTGFVATIDMSIHGSTVKGIASSKVDSPERTAATLILAAADLQPTCIIRLSDLMDVTSTDLRQLDESWHDLALKLAQMD